MPRARGVAAHPLVVKAEEVHALPTFPKVHDPRLRGLELKTELGQDRRQRIECAFGLRPRLAHGQQIIRVADQHTRATVCPLPVG
jgi:hypothetical protein